MNSLINYMCSPRGVPCGIPVVFVYVHDYGSERLFWYLGSKTGNTLETWYKLGVGPNPEFKFILIDSNSNLF